MWGAEEESSGCRMRFTTLIAASIAATLTFPPSFAIADDWVATKLRGGVLQLVDGDWVKLRRGDIVSDDSVIRTVKGGRVAFERGDETIEMGGDTQIQIIDRSGRKFTTVRQHFGSVTVEADVRQVQHFAVQTPHLAAVVKGTRFTVVSGRDEAKVSVQRGHVAVEDSDTHQTTLLSVGQSASTADGGIPLAVSGRGTMPVIYAANGKPAVGSAATGRSDSPKAAAAAAREAALVAGASKKEADRAARAAEKEAKAEEKAAEKEAKSEGKGSDSGGSSGSSGTSGSGSGGGGNSGSGNSENGNSGGSGNSGGGSFGESSGGGNGNSGGGDSSGGKGKKDKD